MMMPTLFVYTMSKNIIRLGIPGKLNIKLYKTINNYLRIKIKLRSFKSSEPINEEKDEQYRGFGYLSLNSDPLDLATWSQRE